MAISTGTNKAQYTCDGSTVAFDLSVKILDEDDVAVLLKNTTTGAETTLVKTTNYTIAPISGDYENGARVTTVATYSSVYTLTLLREVEYTQDLDLEEGGDLPSEGLEDALDKGVMQAQQLDERLARTIVAPATDSSSVTYTLGTAEERANKVFGFSADGSVTEVSLTETGTVGVDTNAGLSIASNVISAVVDDASIEFDGNGDISIKDDGVVTAHITDSNVTLPKLADLADQNVIGNVSGGTTTPAAVPIVGASGLLLDEDAMSSDSNTKGATQQSIKAYVDTEITDSETDGYSPTAYAGGESITFPNGLIIKFGEEIAITAGSTREVTYASAFPNACVAVFGSLYSGTSDDNDHLFRKKSGATTTVLQIVSGEAGQNISVYWFAIGY